MSAVSVRGLTKRYGSTYALRDVDLDVPIGGVTGLVGPNGAGKTTLLSVLAGLRRPTAGTVRFGVRRVAVLPDTPTFEPWLTAREVVELAHRLTAPRASATSVDDALRRAGLSDAADRRTGGFSRGMLQRLGLATTLVGEPELYLLDEPSSALDPGGRREVLELVAGLAQGATVLLSTHILSDVQQVCDRVAVLHRGGVRWQGPLDDLLAGHARPALRLRVRPPLDGVVQALEAAGWVQSVRREGPDRLRIEVSDQADAEASLPRLLAAAGARLVSVEPAAVSLEEVFLSLVGEERA